MPAIHEVATLTSKGQITLPKSIRQALGIAAGGKVAFDLTGDRIVVSRVRDDAEQKSCSDHDFGTTSQRASSNWFHQLAGLVNVP